METKSCPECTRLRELLRQKDNEIEMLKADVERSRRRVREMERHIAASAWAS